MFKTWQGPKPVFNADAGDAGGAEVEKKDGAAADAGAGDADAGAEAGTSDGDGADAGKKDEGASFLDKADKLDDKAAAAAPADFPEDWRDKMAAGDAELRKALDRYASPAAVAKANRDAQTKLRSGKTANDDPMPDAEKEPEKAKEWRKARNIPDDPTGYSIPDSVKSLVTDDDKPRLAGFTEAMHKANIPVNAAQAAMDWYFREQESIAQTMVAADKEDASEVEEALRAEWGPEFRGNSTMAKQFAEEITPGINWFEARLPDGRKLGSVPDFVRALADLGRDRYGDVSLAGSENAARTTARKMELEKMMAEDPDKYHADPKLSKEYEGIMEAELKAAGKNEGARSRSKM